MLLLRCCFGWLIFCLCFLLFSLLTLVVFAISFRLTKDYPASLFSAFIAGFIPVLFSDLLFSVSPLSLGLLLVFLSFYFLTNISRRFFVALFVCCFFLVSLTTPFTLLLVFGLLFFLLFSWVDRLGVLKVSVEVVFFSVFLFFWVFFLFFKNAFLLHGLSFFSQNLPNAIVSNYFAGLSLFSALLSIGFVPVLGGLFVVFRSVFRERDKLAVLFVSFVVVVSLALWLRLVPPRVGFLFLGVSFAILFSKLFASFFSFLSRSRLSRFSFLFVILLVAVFLFNSVFPSFSFAVSAADQLPSRASLDAFEWLSANTLPDSSVLASLGEGHLVTAIANRENVWDNNFLFVEDSDKVFEDVRIMFSSSSQVRVARLFDEYGVDFVVFSPLSRVDYSVKVPSSGVADCLELVYDRGGVSIFRVVCHPREVSS